MNKILVVEDDKLLNEAIFYCLKQDNNLVYCAYTIKQAKEFLIKDLDLIILDINLPDGDGQKFCKDFRKNSQLPIIFLTAKNTEEDIINGFDAGGDDYITKPFSTSILKKRVDAVLKRVNLNYSKLYCFDNIVYDLNSKVITKDNRIVELTNTETKILDLLVQNKNTVLTRAVLIQKIWDIDENFIDEKTLSVNIRRLREKIEDNPSEPIYIKTVFGIGYKWSDCSGI